MNKAGLLINDVTTTPELPPEFRACKSQKFNENRNLEYPEAFKPIQKENYPDLRPLETKVDPDKLFALVENVAHKMPRWEILSADPKARVLEAVVRTSILGYRDDVVIEIREEGKFGTVHIRSKSRLGKGDLGANAKRIRRFLEGVATRLG